MSDGPVLVTGATGTQGGATIDALLDQGMAVRALVRHPTSEAARMLAKRGVVLAPGDFDDASSLHAAVDGVCGVFSVQLPPRPGDPDSELRAGRNLVEAARAAGVRSFVQTSVARAGDHEHFVSWREGRWESGYWQGKAAVNELVRTAGFPHWTVLKPAFLMDNFIPPKATWMFPMLADGIVNTVMVQGAKLDLVSASDVGRFAAAALSEPGRFDAQEIDLAGDTLDNDHIAAMIGQAIGRSVTARHMAADAAIASGVRPGIANSQAWASVEGYKVDIAQANAHGIALETFADWAMRHRRQFAIA